MDGTLLDSPKVSDFLDIENGQIITDDENIDANIKKITNIFSLLFFKQLCFEKRGDFVVVLDCITKSPICSEYIGFVQDLTEENILKSGLKNSIKKYLLLSIGEESGYLVLKPFPGFYDKVETIGNAINTEIISDYNSAKNKMVVTGRSEKLRKDVNLKFKELGLVFPNFGLYLFPGGKNSISEYKIKVIQDSIFDNEWQEIHYFEDREDWLERAFSEITEKYPKIKFHKHHITNLRLKIS